MFHIEVAFEEYFVVNSETGEDVSFHSFDFEAAVDALEERNGDAHS